MPIHRKRSAKALPLPYGRNSGVCNHWKNWALPSAFCLQKADRAEFLGILPKAAKTAITMSEKGKKEHFCSSARSESEKREWRFWLGPMV
ncbi:unnamed protein product [Amoebophrya sp. A120]|nr:unnamed protein product [Amoebophrya sp. A120]|eukprot:GSA120T00014716001.1